MLEARRAAFPTSQLIAGRRAVPLEMDRVHQHHPIDNPRQYKIAGKHVCTNRASPMRPST
jgi:hypothetical protein